jgi:hypothetical protein
LEVRDRGATVLIVTDVQNCFVEGGTLPVRGSAEIRHSRHRPQRLTGSGVETDDDGGRETHKVREYPDVIGVRTGPGDKGLASQRVVNCRRPSSAGKHRRRFNGVYCARYISISATY